MTEQTSGQASVTTGPIRTVPTPATAPTNIGFSERMERYVALAQAEAVQALAEARVKSAQFIADAKREGGEALAKAQVEADNIVANARAERDRIVAEATAAADELRRSAEADAERTEREAGIAAINKQRESEASAHEIVSAAHERVRVLQEEGRADADRLAAKAASIVADAEARRDELLATAEETRQHAEDDAAALLDNARNQAESLIAEAKAETERIRLEVERSLAAKRQERDAISRQLEALFRTIGQAPPTRPSPPPPSVPGIHAILDGDAAERSHVEMGVLDNDALDNVSLHRDSFAAAPDASAVAVAVEVAAGAVEHHDEAADDGAAAGDSADAGEFADAGDADFDDNTGAEKRGEPENFDNPELAPNQAQDSHHEDWNHHG